MNARPNLRQHRRIRESSDDDRGTSCNHFYCARFIRGGRAVAFGAMGCRGVCFTLSADISRRRASWKISRLLSSFCWSQASLSPLSHVAGIGAGIELVQFGVTSTDQGGGKRRAGTQELDSFGGSPHSHLPVYPL